MSVGLFDEKVRTIRHLNLIELKYVAVCVAVEQFLL